MSTERIEPPSADTLLEARRAIEAMLLVATDPTEVQLLAQLVELPVDLVAAMCRELASEYEEQRRGFQLVEVAGGWRYQTHPDTHAYVERYALEGIPNRLSNAALETLAIVAYKQPISRAQMGAIRGVSVDGVLKTLVQRGYVEELGKDDGPGQATLFGTSSFFLEQIGLNSLDDLPVLGDFVPSAEVLEALENTLKVEGVDAKIDVNAVEAEAVAEDEGASEAEAVAEDAAVAEDEGASDAEAVAEDEGASDAEADAEGSEEGSDTGEAAESEEAAASDEVQDVEEELPAEGVASAAESEADNPDGSDESAAESSPDSGAEVADPSRFQGSGLQGDGEANTVQADTTEGNTVEASTVEGDAADHESSATSQDGFGLETGLGNEVNANANANANAPAASAGVNGRGSETSGNASEEGEAEAARDMETSPITGQASVGTGGDSDPIDLRDERIELDVAGHATPDLASADHNSPHPASPHPESPGTQTAGPSEATSSTGPSASPPSQAVDDSTTRPFR